MKKVEFDKILEQAKLFFAKKNFIISDTNLKAILCALGNSTPLLLVGPTGTGKTYLLTLLAEFLGAEYDYASLNGSVTIHDLTQERILAKDGSFEEKDMILPIWLRKAMKGKAILQLDEVNAARAETLLALHPIMDIKGELNLPYTNEVLKVSRDAFLVMSMNEGDEYLGINGMNQAFLNRVIKVHMPYIQGETLINFLSQKTDVPIEQTGMIVQTWTKYMDSKEPEQPTVSIRILEKWCELSKLVGLKEAGIITFASLIADSDDSLSEIIQGDFFVNLSDSKQ